MRPSQGRAQTDAEGLRGARGASPFLATPPAAARFVRASLVQPRAPQNLCLSLRPRRRAFTFRPAAHAGVERGW